MHSLLIFVCFVAICHANIESDLLDDLLSRQDKRVRPVENPTDTITVDVAQVLLNYEYVSIL
jgi:hypothetical protein